MEHKTTNVGIDAVTLKHTDVSINGTCIIYSEDIMDKHVEEYMDCRNFSYVKLTSTIIIFWKNCDYIYLTEDERDEIKNILLENFETNFKEVINA